MSRRRRVFLVGVVVVGVLAVAGALLVPRLGSGAAQDRAGTVLLVPGYGGDRGSLEPLAAALRAAGRDARVVDVGPGTQDLRTQARAVGQAADAALADGAPSVDVVGYSAGGVVARVWVEEEGGDVARRVVTLGSPHHGTEVASLGAVLGSGACTAACRDLAAGSELLAGLPDTPRGPEWVSVWTSDDETVTPPDSAVLAGAVDVRVQDVCAGARVTHGGLPRDPFVVGLVLRALDGGAPIEAAPSAADCAAITDAGRAALAR